MVLLSCSGTGDGIYANLANGLLDNNCGAVCSVQKLVAHGLVFFRDGGRIRALFLNLPATEFTMTTLSPGFCPNCGKQTDTNFKYCEHCAADLSQFRQPPQTITQAPAVADESSEAKSLKKRYKDA